MVTLEDDVSVSGGEVENWSRSRKAGTVEPSDAVEDAADVNGVMVGDSAGDCCCGAKELECWVGEWPADGKLAVGDEVGV